MDENIFWDRKLKMAEVKRILKNEENPRFVEISALLLSRTNKVEIVFSKYMNKIVFCRNWDKIKRQMRENKWSDNRIKYWGAIYKVAVNTINHNELKKIRKKRMPVSSKAEKVGQIIRKARKKKEWTQRELAKKAGLSQQIVSFVEKGYLNFSFETLLKITNALDLKVNITLKRNIVTYTTETSDIESE